MDDHRRRSGGAPSPRVHQPSHPELPPAQAQQVVQYLLAKNYYLTALELLVESQQAGKGEEVADLQRFFGDPEKFPPDELSKHQNANALDVQAQAKEREERLQLAEYELRLAKEDLAEMHKRLEQAHLEAQKQAAVTTGGPSSSPRTSPRGSLSPLAAHPEANSSGGGGHTAHAASDGEHAGSRAEGSANGGAKGGSGGAAAGPGGAGPAHPGGEGGGGNGRGGGGGGGDDGGAQGSTLQLHQQPHGQGGEAGPSMQEL